MRKLFRVRGHGISPDGMEFDFIVDVRTDTPDEAREFFFSVHPKVLLDGPVSVEELKQ